MTKKQFTTSKMFLLAVGQMGFIFLLGTLTLYTLRFYAPTESTGLPLLLPIGVIGIIQGISIAFDALIDPWLASLSDNSKNPKGRRIPFMRKAAIPAALFCVLVFFAPVNEVSWINIVWVAVMLLLYCFCRSIYDINIRALLPDVLPDAYKRTRYFVILSVFNTIGTLLLGTVPTIIAILENVNVATLPAWRISLSVFPIIGVIMMLIGAFSIKETDYVEPWHENSVTSGLFKSIKGVFKNKEFVTYLTGGMSLELAVGVFNAGLLFIIDLLLGLQGTMATVVIGLVTIVALLLYYPLLKLLKRIGKRKMILFSVIVDALMFVLTFFAGPISNLLGPGTVAAGGMWAGMAGEGAKVGSLVLLMFLGVLSAFPTSVGGAVGASMFADLAQYNDVLTGQNSKGMVMGLTSMIGALPSTLVPLVVGLFIYIGSTNQMPTAQGVRATMLVSIAFAAVAFIQFLRYNEKKILGVIAPENNG